MPRFGRRQRGSSARRTGAEGGSGEHAAEAPGPAELPSAAPAAPPSAKPAERAVVEALVVAREDLVVVGDAVGVLDVDVRSPAAAPEAGEIYDQALRSYMLAGERLERAQKLGDLVAVGEALERSRYELACARALLDGADPPARTAPCLFDPRHGASARELQWSPPGAAARPVPACAADAQRLAAGDEPSVRPVALGNRPVSYWDVPVLYGSLLVGYYDRFGGASRLSELLRGTRLGDALSAG